MCDMQKMPSADDTTCDEDSEMNFGAFQAVSGAGTHFVTTNGQLQSNITKIQQNVANNGTGLPQVVSMVGNLGDGVQNVRTMDSTGALSAPQIISVPIALPSAKPGDPQPTVQIQVLNPSMLQQPKYQMQYQIPTYLPMQQGYQQGGTVLTVTYSPETNETGGIQILGNSLSEGMQVVNGLPPEMQLVQQDTKEHMHQIFITPNQQVLISSPEQKVFHNNNNNERSEMETVVIKEECEDTHMDDESSQGTEASDSSTWQISAAGRQDLVKYLSQLPPQQTQALPASLQQFLRLNPADGSKKAGVENWPQIEIEVNNTDEKIEAVAEAVLGEDGTIRIQTKKKKKYKKKPPKPARPRPGTVVIATAPDGTAIFCCPECQMAYPDKDQLENHLVMHKIERRFICGLCGAGLKRKEHLERHKLGHNPARPYVCGVCGKGFKRREHLNLHTVIHTGVKTEMCTQCGKGFYRKDHLRKHMRSHETKRLRDEASGHDSAPNSAPDNMLRAGNTVLPEITIHVPLDSLNMKQEVPTSSDQVPVQINIPPHVVTSLARAQAHDPMLPQS